MDVFKVPTCCTCHVLGYYVPGSKKSLPQSPAMPSMRRRDHLGPRFMGPPRPRRINHHNMPPHMGGGRKPMHPMMMMMQNIHNGMSPMSQMSAAASSSFPVISPLNVVPPSVASQTANSNNVTISNGNNEDEVLRSLLLQYASLREKITKLKDCKLTP